MTEHHGRTKYVNDKCRCGICKMANTLYQQERREREAVLKAYAESKTFQVSSTNRVVCQNKLPDRRNR